MTQILSKGKMAHVDLTCHMQGATRSGACEGIIPATEINGLAEALSLMEIGSNYIGDQHYQRWAADGPNRIVAPIEARVFKTKRSRPPPLRLNNGGAFEYLILIYDQESGRAHMLISYSYG